MYSDFQRIKKSINKINHIIQNNNKDLPETNINQKKREMNDLLVTIENKLSISQLDFEKIKKQSLTQGGFLNYKYRKII